LNPAAPAASGAGRRSERGYTLPELLTVMLLLTLVLTALTTVMVSAINAEANMNRRYDAQSNARTALTTLRRDVHCASTLTVNSAGSVTITLPTSCSFGTGQVTWCTQGAGQRWGLYRVTGATCSGGTQYADYVTTSSVFTFTGSVSGTSLAKLHVDFPVNPSPGSRNSYELIDDIVLHNSSR
jgi:prepilin-type N-terminal cleavage/methylation domain-containing protein